MYPFCELDKILGVENDPLGQADKMGGEKNDKKSFKGPNFAV